MIMKAAFMCGSAAVVSFMSVAPAWGQSTPAADASSIDEIIVTAQKREQLLKDVPIAITALGAEKLAKSGIANLADLAFSVPGMAVMELGAGRQIVAIRGIGSERGSSSLTGVYLDEAPLSGSLGNFGAAYADVRTIDLQRVEVLKGPQGTLFGEGAAGGVIRFVTKRPSFDGTSGEINTTHYATKDGGFSHEVVGIVNLPLVDDKLALRVAGTYEYKAGWIDQPTAGRKNINDNEVVHLRAKLLWKPVESLDIEGMAVIHRNEGGASNIVNDNFQDSTFIQAYDRNAPTNYYDDYDIFNLKATYDLQFAQLVSSTTRVNSKSAQPITQLINGSPRPFLEILFYSGAFQQSITAQEIRLTSSGKSAFNWTVGGLYKRVTNSPLRAIGDPDFAFVLLQGAVAASVPVATLSKGASTSWAGFADASYQITDRFELGGGVRFFTDLRKNMIIAGPGSDSRGRFKATTYRAYASYALNDQVKAYATTGTGFRSGGFNAVGQVANGAPNGFDPEKILSYEIGIKGSLLDRMVDFDVAGFHSTYKGMQEDIAAANGAGTPLQYTANDQDARLIGIEADFNVHLSKALSLRLAGQYIDTKITRVGAGAVSNYRLGDQINFVPDFRVSTSIDYKFDWGTDLPGYVQVDYNVQGHSYYSGYSFTGLGALVGKDQAPVVDFLNIGVGISKDEWKATLFARNLLDNRKRLRAGNTGLWPQARPLTVGVSLGRTF